MNEYEFLRTEMVEDFKGIRTYESSMYAVVVAILAFTVDSKYYFANMLPYLIIISVFFIVTATRSSICKMAAYLNVYHEGQDYNWERRHAVYDKEYLDSKEGGLKWGLYSPYYLLSFTCSAITIQRILADTKCTLRFKVMAIIGMALFTIMVFLLFYWNTNNYVKEKPMMVDRWKTIADAGTDKKNKDSGEKAVHEMRIAQENMVVAQTITELVSLVIEKSDTKEEALESIKKLSIMKHGLTGEQ